MENTTKTCSKCKRELDLSMFHNRAVVKDGKRPDCKECRAPICREGSKKYRERTREERAKYANKWRRANLKRRAATQAKYRTARKNQRCSCCSDEEILSIYKKCPKGFHVDHIYPVSKGGLHCINNLQILSAEDNRKKGSSIPKID